MKPLHAEPYITRFPGPNWYFPMYVRGRVAHYYPRAFEGRIPVRIQLPWTLEAQTPTYDNFAYINFPRVINPPTLCGRAIGAAYYGRTHEWRANRDRCVACTRILENRQR